MPNSDQPVPLPDSMTPLARIQPATAITRQPILRRVILSRKMTADRNSAKNGAVLSSMAASDSDSSLTDSL